MKDMKDMIIGILIGSVTMFVLIAFILEPFFDESDLTEEIYCGTMKMLIEEVDTCTSEKLHGLVQWELDNPTCQ